MAKKLRFGAQKPCYIWKVCMTDTSPAWNENSPGKWDSVREYLAISWNVCLNRIFKWWDSIHKNVTMSWKVHFIQHIPLVFKRILPRNWDSVHENLATSWKKCLILASSAREEENSPWNWDSWNKTLGIYWKVGTVRTSRWQHREFSKKLRCCAWNPCYVLKSMLDTCVSHFETQRIRQETEIPCIKFLLYLEKYSWFKCMLLGKTSILHETEILSVNTLLYLEKYIHSRASCQERRNWETEILGEKYLAVSWKVGKKQACPIWNSENEPRNWYSEREYLVISWKVRLILSRPDWNEEISPRNGNYVCGNLALSWKYTLIQVGPTRNK